MATFPNSKIIKFLGSLLGTGGVDRFLHDKLSDQPLNVKDFGAVPGASDSTTAIQNAVNIGASTGQIVEIDSAYSISITGITIPSNSHIRFKHAGKLTLLPYNATTYQMLRIFDVQNVLIEDALLDGSKSLNSGTTGEWGMGISICGSTNIVINRASTQNCWGDGIYVGASTTGGQAWCQDIRIANHHDVSSRRNGMSIVSADNCKVESSTWDNVGGTNPGSGLDIEPNAVATYPNQRLRGITVNNATSRNCAGAGIGVELSGLVTPSGASPFDIDIEINNHVDEGSVCGFVANPVNLDNASPVRGRIVVNDAHWKYSKSNAFWARRYDARGPGIDLVRPTVIDNNANLAANGQFSAPFGVYDPSASDDYAYGNIRIIEPTIHLSASRPATNLFYLKNVTKVFFMDPVCIDAPSAYLRGSLYTSADQAMVSDKYRQMSFGFGGSTTITLFTATGRIINTGGLAQTFTMQAMAAGVPDFTFESIDSHQMIVRPPATAQLVLLTGTLLAAGKGVYTTDVGAYVKLRALANGSFRIVEQVGAWTNES